MCCDNAVLAQKEHDSKLKVGVTNYVQIMAGRVGAKAS